MSNITSLTFKSTTVKIEDGELISFVVDHQEYIHQRGNPGWRKSDDEMFPVIGPTDQNQYRVHSKKGDGIQDQHGLLRELDYEQVQVSNTKAIYKKTYKESSLIKNSKFPNKSREEFLFWPYDFEFYKDFTVDQNSVKIEFTIYSEPGMPFMLGYHPAFLLSGKENEIIEADTETINLHDVYEVGSNAYPVLETNEIIVQHQDKANIKISTENFNNFMLWTEVPNMICIEPITQYTSYTDQKFSEKNMRISGGKEVFSCTIKIGHQ